MVLRTEEAYKARRAKFDSSHPAFDFGGPAHPRETAGQTEVNPATGKTVHGGQIVNITGHYTDKKTGKIDEYHEKLIARLRSEIRDLNRRIEPYQEEWKRRGGWTRYQYCLTDGRGHIHNRKCAGLKAMSQVSPVPQYSGFTVEELIKATGDMACTICFPDAPLDPFYKAAEKKSAEEQAAARGTRSARSSQLQAKKEANYLLPGGKALKLEDGDRITTVTEAQRELKSALYWGPGSLRPERKAMLQRDALTLANALSQKTGEPAEEIMKKVQDRIDKENAAYERKNAKLWAERAGLKTKSGLTVEDAINRMVNRELSPKEQDDLKYEVSMATGAQLFEIESEVERRRKAQR